MTPSPTRIVRVAVPVPLHRLFDYAVPSELPLPVPGARLAVPFRGRTLVGIAVALNPADAHPDVRPVTAVLDDLNLLGPELLALGQWLASYYQHPLGEALATMLPSAARKPQPLALKRPECWEIVTPGADLTRAPRQRALYQLLTDRQGPVSIDDVRAAGFDRALLRALAAKGLISRAASAPAASIPADVAGAETPLPTLTDEQRQALQSLQSRTGFAPTLLDGITGSGKTEVYLRFIDHVLAQGKQVLVLVPEIALTPQTLSRFADRFGAAAVMHSNMTDQARLQTWLQSRAGEHRIVIGTRSAVFTPFPALGLIVVDEEHDASFKQTDGLRYSARDVAVKRARELNIPLLLGSATPSFESLNNAFNDRYGHLRLTHRAGGATLPRFELIDIRGQTLQGGLSEHLLRQIGTQLGAGGQALVFLNRRGFAPSLLCGHCGWQAHCPGCEWPMTMHRQPSVLSCHHCGRRAELPEVCPDCATAALIAVGTGTQRCEAVLNERFPDTPVYRIDRDSTRSQRALEERLRSIGAGQPAILVGTQMLAKGHHFPDVGLVAIINADGGFMSPDFRAPERTAQLIVQVAGRAGRAERPGVVYVQTYQPDNPLLRTLMDAGYAEFARQELESRRVAELPPYRPMALVRAEAADGEAARRWLSDVASRLRGGLEVYGPAPALMPRVADRQRFQLMITAQSRGMLHRALKPLESIDAPRTVRWSLDIDPYDTF